jgi:hypothetical protein
MHCGLYNCVISLAEQPVLPEITHLWQSHDAVLWSPFHPQCGSQSPDAALCSTTGHPIQVGRLPMWHVHWRSWAMMSCSCRRSGRTTWDCDSESCCRVRACRVGAHCGYSPHICRCRSMAPGAVAAAADRATCDSVTAAFMDLSAVLKEMLGTVVVSRVEQPTGKPWV